MASRRLRVALVGASGYVGGELVRLLWSHPHVDLVLVAGDASAGKTLGEVVPTATGVVDLTIESVDVERIAGASDIVFTALPHGTAAPLVASLVSRGRIVFDLSADFRLRDADHYAQWYGAHAAPALLSEAVYGLVELHREALRTARLIAVPGCYPTASVLALAPLLVNRRVELTSIVIDAKSGVSGAGRGGDAPRFAEASDSVRAYGVGGAHRHIPEIEQSLSELAGVRTRITFTPHVVPMPRGILVTAVARLDRETELATLLDEARALYAGSPVVTVLGAGQCPDTQHVRGSARAALGYAIDARSNRVIAMAAIDNLGKGAAGQAIQGMNVRFGFPEGTGIDGLAVFP